MNARSTWFVCCLFVAACGGSETEFREDSGAVPDAGKGLDSGVDAGVEIPPIASAHAGGQPLVIAIVGDKAYVGLGPSLVIFDVSDASMPRVLGATPPFEGLVYGVALSGTTAYVSESFDLNGRVHVVDVADPASPVVGDAVTLAEGFSSPRNLLFANGLLFAADTEHGVFALDVTDPDAPEIVGELEMPGASGLRLAGDRLYVTGSGIEGTSVRVATADQSLTPLGDVELFGATDVAPTSDALIAFVGLESSGVVDATDPSDIEELLTVPKLVGRTITASDTTAYIPAADGLHVIDVSAPDAVREVTVVDVDTSQAAVSAVDGSLLATVTNRARMSLFDVSDADAPELASAVSTPACADCIGFAVRGDRAIVSDFSSGIRIISLGDFETIGRGDVDADIVGVEDVAVHDDFVFVADWAYGLRVFHVTNAGDIHAIGGIASEGHPSTLEVVGDYLYLGESTNGGALRVLDVSDPTNPRQLDVEVTSKARDLFVQGNYVYVADESLGELLGGLRIFDVTNPRSIRMVGHYDGCQNALGVAVVEDRALLACAGDGVHVVDISDPSEPRMLGSWAGVTGQAWTIAADGDRAYVGMDNGVAVLDISDHAVPRVVTQCATAFAVRAIRVPAPGRVIASAGISGMYQWQID